MAGLNFPENADFKPAKDGKQMLPLLNSSFGSCRSVKVCQKCVNNVKI